MALITETPITVFDLTAIARGYLLWGKHSSWSEGKAGFVTSATETALTVQYHPGIGNVTNHFIIPISEVVNGDWEIRWSEDMSEVSEYPETEEDTEDTDSTESEVEEDETGGTDS